MRFRGNLNVLGRTQKVQDFSAPMKKEVAEIKNDGNESVVTISYKTKFVDSVRYIASSLSSLLDNLAERIHKIKCKYCDCFFEYENVKGNSVNYKCTSCNKDYSNKIDEELKK